MSDARKTKRQLLQELADLRRVEEALRESEARYRAVVEEQTDLVCRYRPDHVLTFVNEAYCRYFEKTPDELVGHTFAPLIIEEDRERVQRELAAIAPDNPVVTVEERVLRPDGEVRWQQWTNRGIFDDAGRIVEYQAVGRDVTDQKRAEEALRQSEANYRAIFNAVNDIVFVDDIETGKVVDMNQRAVEQYGYGLDELDALNAAFRSRSDAPYSRQSERECMRRAAEEGPQLVEWLARDRRGREFWVEVSVRRASIGGQDRLLSVLRDITDRKRAQERARLLSTAVEQSTEGVAVSDVEGNLLFVNDAFASMHGCKPDDVIGRHLSVFHAPDQLPSVEAANRQVRREGAFNGEVWHQRRDGAVFPASMHNTLLRDEAGNPVGMVAAMRDISDRKQAQEALRQSEEDYRLLFEQSVDGILVDAGGRIVRANPALADMVGEPADRLIGRSALDLLHPDDREAAADYARAVLAGDPPSPAPRRYRSLRADGLSGLVEIRSRRILREGRPALQSLYRDVTQQVQLEEQLQQAMKMEAIGQLAGGIAHDFNNLMTGILCHAGLLKSEPVVPEAVRETADLIEGAARRAAALTSQLLGFARRGKQQDVPVNLVATVETSVRLLSRSLTPPIRIRTDFRHGPAYVRGDPVQMEQVVLNLAMNARDALPDGGDITFALDQQHVEEDNDRRPPHAPAGRYAVLSVADTGCGIPRNLHDRVFEPFFTTKPQGKGTGMGLAMVYGIVRNHGGWIDVESTPNAGTTFRVFLPAADTPAGDEPAPVPARRTSAAAAHATGRILVVDDEAIVRDVLKRMLTKRGHEVITAAGAAEAIAYYREVGKEVALAIIDLRMPGMDGRECFQVLKAIHPGIRAILATGGGPEVSVQDLLDEGVVTLIQKPFEADQLDEAIQKALAP